jgi:hypothetical protein
MTRRAFTIAALVLAGLAAGRATQLRAQQSQAAQLISSARTNMGVLEWGAAATLLRQALDSTGGATRAERVRALVLLCAVELNNNRTDSARAAAQAALAIEPRERVDSLDAFSADLVPMFRDLRPAVPASLEIRGLPAGALLTVDGTAWTDLKHEVPAGMHRIEASARGYVTVHDSVSVDPSLPTIRTIVLSPAEPGRLSVSSVPWGLVYLDSEPVGETPLFDRTFPSGKYALTIRNSAGNVLQQQQVQLQPGSPTNLGTFGRPSSPTGRSPALARPDSLFYALQLDSALRLYRALARDTAALATAELRAAAATKVGVIFYAMATGRRIAADRDSAGSAFESAYRLAPSVTLDPTETGNEILAFTDSVRASVLVLNLTVPPDTLVPLRGGHVILAFSTSHSARVVATVERPQAGLSPIFSRTSAASANSTAIEWDLRSPDGQLVPDGRYRLQVSASDAAGRNAPPQVRFLSIAWEHPDTTPVPPPLAPSAFAPETERLKMGPPMALLMGALLGGATAVLPSLVGNATLNKGMATDGGVYIAAGTAALAGIVAFLGGHRERPLPANVAANQRLRTEHETRRTTIAQANGRARENVRAHVRAEAAP